ncbi:MAG TPA: YraN family protein [Candidatus Polarisedimenticolia bacterium]|nr:YraN family protein [Candidatus Polarisedimenticolia bacterium]
MPAGAAVSEERDRYRTARDLGQGAEEAAARFLETRGMRVLARSFRTRSGEIDLVARDGEVLVFVEVKARASLSWGRPSEAVGWRKRARLERAARVFLLRQGNPEPPCRFDVVEVLARPGEPWSFRHIEDAFGTGA